MLLYLTSNSNLDLFDFVQDETLPVKKLSGEFNLKKFVIRDMRSFSHIHFIAIDQQALNDTDEELVEGILGFQAMYDARIIFISEGLKQGKELLSKLYDAGVRNFVTAGDPEEIKKEILECISPEGMGDKKLEGFKIQPVDEPKPKPKAKVKRAKPQTEFVEPVEEESLLQEPVACEVNKTTEIELDTEKERKGIVIGVVGVKGKIGTTTTALNLACFLSSLGAKVSYTECDSSKQLNWLPYYDIAVYDESVEYKGVSFYTMNVKFSFADYDFNILDFGKVLDSGQNLNAFLMSDVRIITAASKPHEVRQLIETLDTIKETATNLIFSFASEHDRKTLEQRLDGYPDHKVYFSTYAPDLFDPNPNHMIWKKIMSGYLKPKVLSEIHKVQAAKKNWAQPSSELLWKEDSEIQETDSLHLLRGEIIWFWGSATGLGVTSAVIRLAKVLAKSNPVLLIDGNLAKPNLADKFACKGSGWEGSWLQKIPGKPPKNYYQEGNLTVWPLQSPLEVDQATEKWSVALFHIRTPKQVVIVDGGTALPPEGADFSVLIGDQLSKGDHNPTTVCISGLGVEESIPYHENNDNLVKVLVDKLKVKNSYQSMEIVNQ